MTSAEKHYRTLGIEPGASLKEIKEAYRDLASVWHPDRFINNPRLQEKAQEKLKEINAAYEYLRTYPPNPDPVGNQKDEPEPPPPTKPKTSMVEKAIKRLYEVPGITNNGNRWYRNKASVYVRFKDGSGSVRLFINSVKILHVYIFDRENVCNFGAYVGWIHSKGLEDVISKIKQDFDEDSTDRGETR